MMLQALSYGVEDKQIAGLGYLPDRKGKDQLPCAGYSWYILGGVCGIPPETLTLFVGQKTFF